MPHINLVLPELGFGDVAITATVWLSDIGTTVYEGDRLLEVHAGEMTIDLPAPATGVLIEQRVAEDDALITGQVLGVVETSG